MKSFENELKKRIFYTALVAVLGLVVIISAFVIKLNLISGISVDGGISTERLVGFFVGLEFPLVCRIMRYKKALSNRDMLEELHIRENDERNRIVALKTSRACIYFSLVILGFVGIIASFINRTVFMTIGFVIILFLVLYLILYIYYKKVI